MNPEKIRSTVSSVDHRSRIIQRPNDRNSIMDHNNFHRGVFIEGPKILPPSIAVPHVSLNYPYLGPRSSTTSLSVDGCIGLCPTNDLTSQAFPSIGKTWLATIWVKIFFFCGNNFFFLIKPLRRYIRWTGIPGKESRCSELRKSPQMLGNVFGS